ncbi:hypothetical protein [Streptomyces sp. NPDC049881]|uniref:hypothetical protein n=1 Tax=Streptomyces sp. NPDC049881 TaxID=3155778 RepID=UPI003427BC0E
MGAVVIAGGALGLWWGRGGEEEPEAEDREFAVAYIPPDPSAPRQVELRAGGVVLEVSLTWSVNGRPGEDLRALPAEPVVLEAGRGDLVLFNVRMPDGGSGEVTCQILVDGTTVASGRAVGPGAMASCEGTAP